MHRRKNVRWNTMAILAMGFFGVIILGGILLWLPVCNRQPIAFMDALFTSTSAVCVTGLVTITPAAQFTFPGQILLLLLIQIGGLGVIGCAALFVLLLKRRVTVRERIVLQETYNADRIGGIVGFVRKVLMGTFLVEGVGALFYAMQFIPQYGCVRGIWYSVFHAVSAFCNAGIDVLGTDSLAGYVDNPFINLTTITLIVVSGIGFTVWYDVIGNGRRIWKHEVPRRWWFTRLTLHSKIAIVTTLVLLVTGTLTVLFLEYNNPETLGNMPAGKKLLAAAFQSVTTRTAGFFTIPQDSFHEETKFFNCILMFIGGSPGGTAGGVKTTTVAMLILACITVIRGGNYIECFGRKISFANFRTGFAVVVVAFAALVCGTLAITIIEPDTVPFINILYETSSAIGTVGLTANLTASLTRASQVIIMLMMYMGRLGPLTLALLFAGKSNPRDRIRELPEERIMIG